MDKELLKKYANELLDISLEKEGLAEAEKTVKEKAKDDGIDPASLAYAVNRLKKFRKDPDKVETEEEYFNELRED